MTRSYTRYGRETTPIHEAAEKGDVNALRRALANGASPNDHDQNGWEPLKYLCFHGDNEDGRLACLKALLEAGADINAGLDEWTNNRPLMYAAQYSNANVVAALLKSEVIAADGIQRYERAHLNALAASFAPKFSHLLPPELVRRVVEYAFHVGDY